MLTHKHKLGMFYSIELNFQKMLPYQLSDFFVLENFIIYLCVVVFPVEVKTSISF